MKEITLNECLAGLTKQNLTYIRTHLGIQGVSNLKKQELIDVLVEKIPEKLADLFLTMDSEEISMLKQVADQGGQAKLPLEADRFEFFNQRAILFPVPDQGEAVVAMPREVLACFQALDASVEQIQEQVGTVPAAQQSEWIRLTKGLLYYYGVQTLEQLLQAIEQQLGVAPDPEQLSAELHAAANAGELGYDTQMAWHAQTVDPDAIQQEQKSRVAIGFFPFTKEELLAAGEEGFMDRTPIYRNFVNLIKANYNIGRDEADAILQECVYGIRNGKSSGDLFKLLQSRMELDEVEMIKAVMEQTIILHNHTRQWSLKGYSPNELSNRSNPASLRQAGVKAAVSSVSSKKKIGRNDPCPCGSGKKYKKCCGQ